MQHTPQSLAQAGTNYPSANDAAPVVARHTSNSTPDVGESRLSDSQREEAIARAGQAIERHMAIYARESCLAARGDADRARLCMERLIAGRSPEQVRRMELERGLA